MENLTKNKKRKTIWDFVKKLYIPISYNIRTKE